MKKIMICFLGMLFLASCSQEEVCYSCDENVDAFVKENLKVIQQMNRADIVKYPNEKQRGMYRAVSAEKKKEIWQDKFAQINSLDLSDGERELMHQFQEFVNTKDFSISNTKEEITYLNNLRQVGVEKFGWTQRFIVSAFGHLENIDRTGIIVARDFGEVPVFTNPDPKEDCDCRWGFACLDGPCDERPKSCKKDDDSGCGWFWLESCTGLCRPDLG